ncbi:MAG: glucan endo-1,3-beta-D-glucosidase [Polaribacter sp.]|nr:glucan endo-1,3-beta-D-glucosidase [Polaribacter sp.]
MKKINYIYLAIFSLLLSVSCQEDDYEFGNIITPSDITITAEIVGKDTSNPNGDGSGMVHFTATATNAVSYKFVYDNKETVALSGTHTYNFSNLGTNTYAVTVVVSGTAGVTSSKTIQVDVLSVYQIPADLLTMLTDNSTRSWRIKKEAPGHFGVGPADETSPIWYGAGPDEKAGLGMYDDTYIFNVNKDFTHTTNGTIFGKAVPLQDDFGASSISPNGNDEIENYELEEYIVKWQLTAPGGVETLTLSGNGFAGFYVGSHSYTIISRSVNEMVLRTVGFDGLGWFITLIAQ